MWTLTLDDIGYTYPVQLNDGVDEVVTPQLLLPAA